MQQSDSTSLVGIGGTTSPSCQPVSFGGCGSRTTSRRVADVEFMPPSAVIPVVSDASIKEDDQEYLEKHNVGAILQALLEKVLREKPNRPVSLMIEEVWRLRVSKQCLKAQRIIVLWHIVL